MDKDKIKIILFAAFLFIVGAVFILMPDKPRNYRNNGIEVTVTVTEKYGLKTKQYYGVYTDENGNKIVAKVIPNKSGVYEGDELIGYYMSSDPATVICYNGSGLMILLRLFGAAFCVGGVLIIIKMRQIDAEYENNRA